jgi:hypothetical protein
VVADFSKIGTIHIKIGIDQTKIDTVHPKFDKNIRINQICFFQPAKFLNTGRAAQTTEA